MPGTFSLTRDGVPLALVPKWLWKRNRRESFCHIRGKYGPHQGCGMKMIGFLRGNADFISGLRVDVHAPVVSYDFYEGWALCLGLEFPKAFHHLDQV